MDALAPIITSLTTTIAVLCALWIYRRTRRVDTVHSVFSVGVITYTLFHFFACGTGYVDPVHEGITGLFVSSVAWVNAYCSTCNTSEGFITLGVDRRKKDNHPHGDRRQIESHTLITPPTPNAVKH